MTHQGTGGVMAVLSTSDRKVLGSNPASPRSSFGRVTRPYIEEGVLPLRSIFPGLLLLLLLLPYLVDLLLLLFLPHFLAPSLPHPFPLFSISLKLCYWCREGQQMNKFAIGHSQCVE